MTAAGPTTELTTASASGPATGPSIEPAAGLGVEPAARPITKPDAGPDTGTGVARLGGFRSGELAAAGGVSIQTLRYYERRGLLPPPDRSPGGHRVFPAATVDRLRAIKAAQRLGFTLTEVAALLGVAGRGRGRPADFAARGRAKLAEVEARIAELQSTAETLRAAVRAGCDDLATCAAESCCPIPFTAAPPAR